MLCINVKVWFDIDGFFFAVQWFVGTKKTPANFQVQLKFEKIMAKLDTPGLSANVDEVTEINVGTRRCGTFTGKERMIDSLNL